MIPRRREFNKQTKRDADDRAGDICECPRLVGIAGFTGEGCGVRLTPLTGRYYEHIICDGIGGDPTLENCAVLTKTCWRKKTSWDQPTVAMAKRVWDAWRGIDGNGRPFPGSRRDRLIKRMNGAVDERPGR